MSAVSRCAALLRLETSEALRSRWLVFTGSVYAAVFGLFVWLGLRESRVLGFTGVTRVVLNVANAVVLAVPLVALVATSQCVVRARQSGFFELMLSQPVRRSDWFRAVVLSRLAVVVGPLAALLAGAVVIGAVSDDGGGSAVPVALRTLAVTAALAWSFLGLGLWISSATRSPERATVLALVAWLGAAALHDFAVVGVLLRAHLPPAAVFALAALNPAEATRIAILSGVDPDLSVLGPVGYWLANSLGPRWALLVGVAWPLALGTFALQRAGRRVATSDLVG